jgi:hypothetical protein
LKASPRVFLLVVGRKRQAETANCFAFRYSVGRAGVST